ncbi:MAG: FAD-binding oxidoreductase [Oscillospiraceae bacterium]
MQELYNIISDPSRVKLDGIEDKYLSDTLGRLKGTAAALVFPVSTEEVSGVMRFAHENGIPVTPRGAGTNLVGSTVPHGNGIILDLSLMNHVLEIDENTLTAVIEPGVVLQDFQRLVEERGLFYPPDPGEKTATIGGNISTNAGGMRAVKYGVTRDYVRGLELVLADGKVITVGSKNVKDASGLSLKNLIIGSEGTLAVITKCILKLIPKPERSLSAVIPFPDLNTGISAVLSIIRANVNPTAIEFAERSVISLGEDYTGLKFPCPEAGAYIIVTLDGRESEVSGNAELLREAALKAGALDFITLDDPETAANIWKVRGCLVKAVEAVSEQEPVDLVVPIDKTADFIRRVHEVEEKSGMQMVAFGHAGDGNVHLCMVRGNRDDQQWEHDLRQNMTGVYNYAYSLGGLTSGEHGIGVAKRPYYLSSVSPDNLAVMRAIKSAMDEKHILNDHISYLE